MTDISTNNHVDPVELKMAPVKLTENQIGDLQIIWTTHAPLPDDAIGSLSQLPRELDDTTYIYIARLVIFLLKVLQSQEEENLMLRKTLSTLFLFDGSKVRLWESRQTVLLHYKSFHTLFISHEQERAGGPLMIHNQPQLQGFLYHHPEMALAAIGSAFALTMATLWRMQNPSTSPLQLERALASAFFVIQFNETEQIVGMGHIKTGLRNKFISVQGHVLKARPKRLRLLTGHFKCCKCDSHFPWKFADGRYNVPDRCQATQKCRSKQFTIVRQTATYMDYQELLLQEVSGTSTSSNTQTTGEDALSNLTENVDSGSRTPRQLSVEVTDELVDFCSAGDVVRVVGTVKSISTALAAGRTGRQALETSTYKLYLKANYIVNTTSDLYGGDQSSNKRLKRNRERTNQVTFTPEQMDSIQKIAHADHRIGTLRMRQAFPFDLLVHSLCPSIIGHELVKASLLLGLLGGTPPPTEDVNGVRCNSHVLVVGDPGMGKSQMLLAANQIASRSVYVGGNTATTTGLTVSLTKEAGGEVGIEAGALVLADRGVCCIDEFDKMAKSNQDGKWIHSILLCKNLFIPFLEALIHIQAYSKPWNSNKFLSPKRVFVQHCLLDVQFLQLRIRTRGEFKKLSRTCRFIYLK